LAKYIHHELLPVQDEESEALKSSFTSVLPLQVIEAAIRSVATRNNYGLDGIAAGKLPPAAVCAWRWEVKAEYRTWLPKNTLDKALVRIAERIQVRCFFQIEKFQPDCRA
jgi:chromatin assembly factor 1 subunit A